MREILFIQKLSDQEKFFNNIDMLFLNLIGEKCGISHFFREDWTEKAIKIQISAFMFKVGSQSDYWDNTQFISRVRQGKASVIDIDDFRIIFFNGSITGGEGFQDVITPVGYDFSFETQNVNTNNGFWGLILKNIEDEKKDETEFIETLVRMSFSDFIIHNHAFTFLYQFSNSNINGRFEAKIPISVSNIQFDRIDESSLKNLINTHQEIEKITDNGLKRKIKLSMSWFNKTVNTTFHEKFMYLWIALEILTMKDGSNIKPLKELLSKAYNIPSEQLESSFCIGRIYGLRGRIFHNGFTPNLEFEFLYFCDLLYFDSLNQILGLECKQLALNYLNKKK